MNLLIHILLQLTQSMLLVFLAPLLLGWINQSRAWLMNKKGAGLIQPYRELKKLFYKDAVIAENASFIFRMTPYLRFSCMWLAAGIIPVITTHLPFSPAADVIALVGIFAFSRAFLALSAMDIGTAFGSLGARREMMIGFLAEPGLLMVFFGASLLSNSTALTTIVTTTLNQPLMLHPGLAFAAVAFLMILLAENTRLPVDNPATHLELTMIHEAMVLEYSARHLALIKWSSSIKLINYVTMGLALFIPWGIAQDITFAALGWAFIVLIIKLILFGFILAMLETLSAKLRLFRAPEFLATAFMLAVLGILINLLMK